MLSDGVELGAVTSGNFSPMLGHSIALAFVPPALEIGAAVLYPPTDYPAYGDGYYAVFFADPDGIKLEFVYRPL